jgi:cytochrome c peroxidase
MRTSILIAAAALILAIPVQAKPTFVKKAQELGFADVKNCMACHAGVPKKDGDMTERGKFLKKVKAEKKAAEVDLNWLKDYKGK